MVFFNTHFVVDFKNQLSTGSVNQMFWHRPGHNYVAIEDDQKEDGEISPWSHHASGKRMDNGWSRLSLVLALVVSIAGNVYLLARPAAGSKHQHFAWSNELKSLPARKSIQFDSSITPHSKFTGFGPDVDAEWDRFSSSPLIDGTAVVLAVTEENVLRSGKQDTSALPFDTMVPIGDRYMATIEMFHQLHCVNILRKTAHLDYYKDIDPFFSSHDIGNHTDHCIEMIRQVVMCNADSQLITFHWVDGWPGAVPDFNTWHSCRDPEQVLQWAQERAAPLAKPLDRPADAETLPDRP